ncbi:MAG: TonB-dependent receptor [Flavobacteriales bacterium]
MKSYLNYLIPILFTTTVVLRAQGAALEGRVTDEHEQPIPAVIRIKELKKGVDCNFDGSYRISAIPSGTFTVTISSLGYLSKSKQIRFADGKTYVFNARLREDSRQLNPVVVTGSRERINRKKSPVIVNVIGKQTLDQIQAVSLGEGIDFQPGLRYEDNCQNCGFSQLRMNGLSGSYTQILIDSRPIYSALAGIYGLDQIPTTMIDRIEVVSGGGSSLYGGNAIAGTVNIITKDPIVNGFQIKTNTALTDGARSDNNVSFSTSTASDELDLGAYFYGNFRRRSWWDANNDQYSEIPELHNNSFGFNSYYKPGDRSKLKLESHFIDEFRRGGNKFDQPPHEADIAEQLDHSIYGGQLSYELNSKDQTNHYSAYVSGQAVNRKSYYGGGQDLNAYGRTNDVSTIGGFEWNKRFHNVLNDEAAWVSGLETDYEKVRDKMSAYERSNDQKVWNTGIYSQLDFQPIKKLKASIGARLDWVHVNGDYLLGEIKDHTDYTTTELNPRINLLYACSDHLRFRTAYARGFRAPQAFDEDLHVEQVGGEQSFIMLSKDLKPEHSDSFTASVNWDHATDGFYTEILLEGFYTQINDPLINEPVEEKEDYRLVQKRNGSGSYVSGLNFRIDNSFHSRVQTQIGLTWETARYDKPEEILEAPDGFKLVDGISSSKKIMRTPNLYGYFTANWGMSHHIDMNLSGVYTGSMVVPYEGGGTFRGGDARFFNSPEFFELNTKINYRFQLSGDYSVNLSGGIQNLFNSYQEEFDTGPNRASTFIYGPSRPRTFFIGIKIGNLD